MTLKYLAYGSNMLNQRLLERVPSSRFIETVVVSQYCLNFSVQGIDQSGKCNMHFTGRNQDTVYAAVYEMAANEKSLLDVFEGDSYSVETLKVTGEGTEHEVFVYLGKPEYLDHSLKPFAWYRDIVALGAYSRAFPQAYVQAIHNIEVVHDPDADRHAKHQRIIELSQTQFNQKRHY